tara:strand:- start:519 stop:914 length:396 start_codon:yes stop_codon:yes gene_type:complete
MQTKEVPTIAIMPEEVLSLSQKVEKWTYGLCKSLEQNYQQSFPNSSSNKTFKMELGRKYWKIVQTDIDADGKVWSGGVHAFVDRNTGQVYKPASYKSPAKHVRYDMRIINNREQLHNPNFTDWAGGYLYLR